MTIVEPETHHPAPSSKPGWRRRRALGKALLVLLAPVLAIAGIWQLQPSYMVLDIPVARHQGGGEFWWEKQYSQLVYADAWGVLYVHRQVGSASVEAQGWRTVEEAFAYFDAWLAQRGWTAAGPLVLDPVLPESRVLGPDHHKGYWRSTDGARVAIAIWPKASVQGFNVVVTTSRPSWMRRLSDGLD